MVYIDMQVAIATWAYISCICGVTVYMDIHIQCNVDMQVAITTWVRTMHRDHDCSANQG
jgi:hypothetical protein